MGILEVMAILLVNVPKNTKKRRASIGVKGVRPWYTMLMSITSGYPNVTFHRISYK